LRLLAILPLMTGCVTVESKNPLSPPRLAVADKRLEGLWRNDDKQPGSGYLYIAYRPHDGGSVMFFGPDDTSGIGTMQYDFFVTRGMKDDYLNLSHAVYHLQGATQRDRSGNYTFAEYHFTWLGQLIYRQVEGDAFSKAVEGGKLRGKLTYDKKTHGVTNTLLTDTSERVLGFMESSKPEDVFGTPQKYSRIGGP
jgi:hypothetical protein